MKALSLLELLIQAQIIFDSQGLMIGFVHVANDCLNTKKQKLGKTENRKNNFPEMNKRFPLSRNFLITDFLREANKKVRILHTLENTNHFIN